MLKLSENPPVLFPAVDDLASIPGMWWVAHTKARCEKSFATDLAGHGIAYFLPMIERVTFSGGRKRRGMMPLFSSYVFFCGSEKERHQALLTDRLCQAIVVKDQRKFVSEISCIHQVLRSGMTIDPYPSATVGRRCRIARGPLEGIEGTIVRRQDGAQRLVLQVTMLGQGAAVEIEPDLLETVA